MNEQVKELIERVRLTDEEIDALFHQWLDETQGDVSKKLGNTFSQAIANAATNKVLNDPDLYMIDEERSKERYIVLKYAVISLAEAIKESNGNKD